MKHLEFVVVIAVVALGLMTADVMAPPVIPPGGPGGGKVDITDPSLLKIESPFKGVVNYVSPTYLTVRGELTLLNPPANNANAGKKSKPILKNIRFYIKDTVLTRNSQPCEFKDIQSGDTATVTFMTEEGGHRRFIATQIDFTKESSAKK